MFEGRLEIESITIKHQGSTNSRISADVVIVPKGILLGMGDETRIILPVSSTTPEGLFAAARETMHRFATQLAVVASSWSEGTET